MNTTLTLTKSSIKMFVRNKQALFFTLFTPVIIMAVFGFIGFDRVPKVDVGIVTENPSPATQQFIDSLKNVPAFDIHQGSNTEEAEALSKGERSVVIALPNRFIPENLTSPVTQTARVYVNAGDQQQAETVLSIFRQTLDQTTLQAVGAPSLFAIERIDVNSRNLRYIDFLVPGIVALSVMQMAVFSVAFVFVDYKEKGVLKRLVATPMKPYQFVTANVVTRLLVALLQAAILIAIGVFAFKAQVIGSYWLVALIALLGAVMFLGLGFTISGFAKTVESVPALANLVVFPMLFLGGTFFPLDSMPDWLARIAGYMPLTYFTTSMREVMIEDAGLGDVSTKLLWMLGWSAVLITLAVFTFRFSEQEN